MLDADETTNSVATIEGASESAANRTLKSSVTSYMNGLVAPLQRRQFQLFFAGQTISTLGDAFYVVVLPWIILSNGGTAEELGFVLGAYGLTRLATLLVGGILSDRISSRRVMLLADIARTILTGLMAFEVTGNHFSLPVVIATVAALGLFTGLFVPASYAILPDLLPKKELQAGNALNTSALQFATLLGSGIAGIIVARLQPDVALVIDALSFAVSAFSLAAIGKPVNVAAQQPAEQGNAQSSPADAPVAPPEETKISFAQYCRTSRLFQITILVVTVTFLTIGGTLGVALPIYAHGPLAAGANGYGLLLALFGAGELIGGLAVGGFGRLPHRPVVVLVMQIAQAITFIAVPLFWNLAVVGVILAFAGVLNGLINVLYFTLIEEYNPAHLMGRIWGVVMFATFGLYPISVTLGGFVTDRYGPIVMFLATGITLIVAAVIGLLQREIREIA